MKKLAVAAVMCLSVSVTARGEAGLLLWLEFDETTGTTAADSSGSGNDGTLRNMAGTEWTTGGATGGALEFSGTGDYVVDEDGEQYINGLDAFTVALWIRSDVLGTDRGFIVARDPDGKVDDVLCIRYDAAGYFGGGTALIKAGITTTAGIQHLESSEYVQTTAWQHVALTWQNGGQLVLYINGVPDTPTYNDSATSGVITGATKLIVGRGVKDTAGSWDGLIDDVRLYDRALSEAEIQALIPPLPPTAEDESIWTETDTPVDIDVLANDTDPNPWETLTVDSFQTPTTAGGTVTDLGGGMLQYTPAAAWTGTDSFTYTVTDGASGFDTATVTVVVGPAGEVGLVGWWKLDETAGTIAADSSPYGNDGGLFGDPQWSSGGMIGGALDFDGYDGSDDYVEVPNSPSLENVQEGDYTLAAWVCPDTVPPNTSTNDSNYSIIAKTGWHVGLRYTNGEKFQVEHWLSGDVWSGTLSASAFAPGAFRHVVGVVSRTNGTVELYVNGRLEGSTTFTAGTPAREYGTEPWRIGTANPGAGGWRFPMDGKIDDVRVFDRALTVEEIGAMIPPLPPQAGDDYIRTEVDVPVDIDVFANDVDVNHDPLSVDSFDAASAAGGTVTDIGGGILRYAPPSGWTGVDDFSYTVADGTGGFDTATVTVVVGALRVIYVDAGAAGANDGTSWADAYVDLQSALAVAMSGDDIWVAEGIYRPTSGTDRTISFRLVEWARVYGGFAGTESRRSARDWTAHETILSGDIRTVGDDTDNSYHVISGVSNVVLDGFTVTGGNADGGWPNNVGGGMYNQDVAGLTVANCTFSDNSASYGGGMSNRDSSPAVTDCVFSGNSANRGGGMLNEGSFLTVTNCTFSGNTAISAGAGGISNTDNSSLAATNCIIWGNPGWGGRPEIGGSSTCTHSNIGQIGGFTDGGGNINADPLFVDADGADDIPGTADDDLRLQAGSPCIDSADGDAAPELDLDGNPRHDDIGMPNVGSGAVTYADMGAYEFQENTPPVTPFAGGCRAARRPGAAGRAGLAFCLLIACLAIRRFPVR